MHCTRVKNHFYFCKNICYRISHARNLRRYIASSSFPVLPNSLNEEAINLTNAKLNSEKLLQYHEEIKKKCFEGGGEKGKLYHVKKNKKILPRERVRSVFDPESDNLELCLQAGLGLDYGDIPGGSLICLIGQINGQYCLVTANDATLKGGTYFPISVVKAHRAQEVSNMNLLPSINLVDSGGGFLPLQAEFFPDKKHGGRGFYNQAVDGSKGIPQFSLVCGSCTAGGAYVPMMCDDAGIVDRVGSIFLGGPPLVKAATGEDISVEDLGGATLHCNVSGCTDYFASSEEEGFEMLRDVVSTLEISPPQDRSCLQPRYESSQLDVLCGLEKVTKPQLLGVISRLVDDSRLRQFKQNYGANLITGYSFIDGLRVGIVANCGPVMYEDGLKGSHFVQNCNQRNIPIVFLQNSGPADEYWEGMAGLTADEGFLRLRGRAAMSTAVSCAQVPKIAINIGGCHGDDNFTMCGPSFNPNFNFCWPGTEITLHPPKKRSRSSQENSQTFEPYESFDEFPEQSCWFLAARAVVDGIITPSETRQVIVKCLKIFDQKKRITCEAKQSPIFRF